MDHSHHVNIITHPVTGTSETIWGYVDEEEFKHPTAADFLSNNL
jgi:hypothetical protein